MPSRGASRVKLRIVAINRSQSVRRPGETAMLAASKVEPALLLTPPARATLFRLLEGRASHRTSAPNFAFPFLTGSFPKFRRYHDMFPLVACTADRHSLRSKLR